MGGKRERRKVRLVAPGWTVETYAAHNEALRMAEVRFQAERDRRYAEVNVEKEKALKIKETADLAALQLAREIQTYKDEQANELREQINRERGLYVTRDELASAVRELQTAIKPLTDYIAGDRGGNAGSLAVQNARRLDNGQRIAMVSVFALIVSVAVAIIVATR